MYLGIDCGTQGTKVLVWDADRRSVAGAGYAGYPLYSDEHGKKEQHPADWIDAMINATRQALAQAAISPSLIRGIGVSGQQHGLVLLDECDRVIRPAKLWCDTGPAELLAEFERSRFTAPSAPLSDIIGIHVPVAFTLAKLLWVKALEPENYRKIRKIMLPHEYLNFYLTGEYRAECSDASGTGYFDTRRRCWSEEVLDRVDPLRPFSLPKLIRSAEPHGELRPAAAAEMGLDAGIVVASGGGDNMMSAIGTGNISEGQLTMSLGTSGTLFTFTERQIDSRLQPDINAFCSANDGWLPLVSTMNMTNATTAFRQLLNKSLAEFETALSASSPGAGGISCLPYLNGARLPNLPAASASLTGITGHNLNADNLLRAVVEGVSFNLCRGIDILSRCDLRFTRLVVIGGGSNSEGWRQIIANVSGLSVVKSLVTDAGALGGALQAHWCHLNQTVSGTRLGDVCPLSMLVDGSSIVEPRPEMYSRYRELYLAYHQQVDNYKSQWS